MANVLTSFLVGIGWDTSDFDKGTRDIERGLQGVKTTTLGVSAAILGVFAGVATAAVNTAQRVDQLALSTQNLNTNKQFVANLGGALRLMGGDAADALSEVRNIEQALTNFRLKGELGAIGELPFAQVQIQDLAKSQSASEFLSKLSDQLPGLTNPQRQLVQESLGLSDATMKAMRDGGQQFEGLLQRAQDLTGGIEQLTDNARALSEQMAAFGLRMQGVTNELTEKTLPGLVRFTSWANRFVDEHRADITGVIDTVAEHPGTTTALGASATAAVVGATLGKLGLTTLGGVGTAAGAAGIAVTGATIGTDVLFSTLENKYPGLKSFEATVDQSARQFGLGKLVDFSDWLFNTDQNEPSPERFNSGDMSKPAEEWKPLFPWLDRRQYQPDAVPQIQPETVTPEQNAQINADAISSAMRSTPIKVDNSLTLNVALDGQALDARITEVQERAAYSTIDDMRSTTAR